jgi:GNAT superfamily N-acetyltransferase
MAGLSRMTSFGGLPEIRIATRGDATAMTQARREAILSKAPTHYDQALVTDWADATNFHDRVRQIEQQIADPGRIVLVAEAGGAMLGFAVADLQNSELEALYTRPNDIGGVGRALLAALEQRAFATIPFLACDASLNAEGFYQANGYKEEARRDFVTRGGLVSRVVRMKKLRPDRSRDEPSS